MKPNALTYTRLVICLSVEVLEDRFALFTKINRNPHFVFKRLDVS